MRICFIGHFTAGGTERATALVANGLCDNNDIFLVNTCDRQPYFYLSEKVSFEFLTSGNIINKNIGFFKFLKEQKIDVVITVEAMAGIFSLIPARLTGCKHIVWEHANYFQTQGSRYIQKIRQLELKTADAYIVLTKRDLNNFKQNFKIKSRIDYIYNPIESVADVEYDMSSKTIVSVGHIRKIKNFTTIPDIAKIVFAKHPDWNWKIYGATEGEEYEKLKAKISDYGLEEKIIFCGRSNDMDSVYKSAAMYVMTSLQEGLPMVLLEAKARKLPLVSFDIETGPDEIIRDSVNGFLVPPYDIEVMAEKINELIENDSLKKEFSDNSVLDIEHFDENSVTQKWESVLKSV
ncbi:MAG: glycosyltransferase family 4 protein [Clostridia bacterium]|nr:glycosyltransferase family 4 protein [Clostridia bacterium]